MIGAIARKDATGQVGQEKMSFCERHRDRITSIALISWRVE
jgi:hypothetical protein